MATQYDMSTLIDEAAHWFVRLQGAGMSGVERSDYLDWVSRSVANREAFDGVSRTWERTGIAAPHYQRASGAESLNTGGMRNAYFWVAGAAILVLVSSFVAVAI